MELSTKENTERANRLAADLGALIAPVKDAPDEVRLAVAFMLMGAGVMGLMGQGMTKDGLMVAVSEQADAAIKAMAVRSAAERGGK